MTRFLDLFLFSPDRPDHAALTHLLGGYLLLFLILHYFVHILSFIERFGTVSLSWEDLLKSFLKNANIVID